MTENTSVLLVIHAPTVPIVSERRLPSDTSLLSIRQRLELLSGIPPESQKISLWSARTDDQDSHASLLLQIESSRADTLAQLGAKDGMGLKVEDTRDGQVRDQFGEEEEEKISKYEMGDEEYAKRSGEYVC